jgi:hypothetical protein
MTPRQPDTPEPFPREPIPPDILEWARQTFDEEEYTRLMRQMEAEGGFQLDDFIAEVEARATAK